LPWLCKPSRCSSCYCRCILFRVGIQKSLRLAHSRLLSCSIHTLRLTVALLTLLGRHAAASCCTRRHLVVAFCSSSVLDARLTRRAPLHHLGRCLPHARCHEVSRETTRETCVWMKTVGVVPVDGVELPVPYALVLPTTICLLEFAMERSNLGRSHPHVFCIRPHALPSRVHLPWERKEAAGTRSCLPSPATHTCSCLYLSVRLMHANLHQVGKPSPVRFVVASRGIGQLPPARRTHM
jgi:hypothetical protein